MLDKKKNQINRERGNFGVSLLYEPMNQIKLKNGQRNMSVYATKINRQARTNSLSKQILEKKRKKVCLIHNS